MADILGCHDFALLGLRPSVAEFEPAFPTATNSNALSFQVASRLHALLAQVNASTRKLVVACRATVLERNDGVCSLQLIITS